MKLINAKIQPNEGETLDDLVLVSQERMDEYAKKHPDFTCVIEKHIDENYIMIRTLKLGDSAN
jgi:hypothetical protein